MRHTSPDALLRGADGQAEELPVKRFRVTTKDHRWSMLRFIHNETGADTHFTHIINLIKTGDNSYI